MHNNIRTYSRDSVRKYRLETRNDSTSPPSPLKSNKQLARWRISYETVPVNLGSSDDESMSDEMIDSSMKKRLASKSKKPVRPSTPPHVIEDNNNASSNGQKNGNIDSTCSRSDSSSSSNSCDKISTSPSKSSPSKTTKTQRSLFNSSLETQSRELKKLAQIVIDASSEEDEGTTSNRSSQDPIPQGANSGTTSTSASSSSSIDKHSRGCLETGRMLNDTIVDFYMNYLIDQSTPTNKTRFHLFNTFFFSKLKDLQRTVIAKGNSEVSCYSHTVGRWDKHVKIFDKDYLVVPVCDLKHWVLVIVCFANKLSPSDEPIVLCEKPKRSIASSPSATSLSSRSPIIRLNKSPSIQDTNEPAVLIFDSLGYKYMSKFTETIRIFLTYRWKLERPTEKPRNFRDRSLFRDVTVKGGKQRNSYDCGVHMMYAFEKFLERPLSIYKRIMSNEDLRDEFDLDTRLQRRKIASLLPEAEDQVPQPE